MNFIPFLNQEWNNWHVMFGFEVDDTILSKIISVTNESIEPHREYCIKVYFGDHILNSPKYSVMEGNEKAYLGEFILEPDISDLNLPDSKMGQSFNKCFVSFIKQYFSEQFNNKNLFRKGVGVGITSWFPFDDFGALECAIFDGSSRFNKFIVKWHSTQTKCFIHPNTLDIEINDLHFYIEDFPAGEVLNTLTILNRKKPYPKVKNDAVYELYVDDDINEECKLRIELDSNSSLVELKQELIQVFNKNVLHQVETEENELIFFIDLNKINFNYKETVLSKLEKFNSVKAVYFEAY